MFEFFIGVFVTIIIGFAIFYSTVNKEIKGAEKELIDLSILAFVAGDNDFDYAKDLFHSHLKNKMEEKKYTNEQLQNFNHRVLDKYNNMPQNEYDAYFLKVVEATKRFNEQFKVTHHGSD